MPEACDSDGNSHSQGWLLGSLPIWDMEVLEGKGRSLLRSWSFEELDDHCGSLPARGI